MYIGGKHIIKIALCTLILALFFLLEKPDATSKVDVYSEVLMKDVIIQECKDRIRHLEDENTTQKDTIVILVCVESKSYFTILKLFFYNIGTKSEN